MLRHGAEGFTSRPKEGVLRNFIALKISSPRLGLNPRTLGPIASTLLHHQNQKGCFKHHIALSRNDAPLNFRIYYITRAQSKKERTYGIVTRIQGIKLPIRGYM
jgi:hypothetical protein